MQQLIDTAEEEQKRFLQEVTDLGQNLSDAIPTTSKLDGEVGSTSDLSSLCSPLFEMLPVIQIVQSYQSLHEKLDEQCIQSDLRIKNLLAKYPVLNRNSSNALNEPQSRNPDGQVADSDAWESDVSAKSHLNCILLVRIQIVCDAYESF